MGKSAVAAMLFQVCGLHVATKVPAIHFRLFAFTADNATAHFLSHRFT
jgi:hypothetical protein